MQTGAEVRNTVLNLVNEGDNTKWSISSQDQYSGALRTAHRKQKQLGEYMIWKGILIQTFGDVQEQIYRSKNLPKERNGTVWARRIVEAFQSFFETIWKLRNERVHGKTGIEKERESLRVRIRDLLQKKFFIPPRMQSLYRKGRKLLTDNKKN